MSISVQALCAIEASWSVKVVLINSFPSARTTRLCHRSVHQLLHIDGFHQGVTNIDGLMCLLDTATGILDTVVCSRYIALTPLGFGNFFMSP